jgi:hypothetical protein
VQKSAGPGGYSAGLNQETVELPALDEPQEFPLFRRLFEFDNCGFRAAMESLSK